VCLCIIQKQYLEGFILKTYTILIPCYNEAPTIGVVLENLTRAYPHIEIIVVDNNSNDGSAEIIKNFPVTYLKEKLRGKGYAIKRGLGSILTDSVILHDADNEYDTLSIKTLTDSAVNQPGMILGVRPRSNLLFSSKLANAVIKLMLHLKYKQKINDCLTGMRIVPLAILKQCSSLGFELETEINKLCLKAQVPIIEVPISYTSRIIGKKIKFWDMFKLVRMAAI